MLLKYSISQSSRAGAHSSTIALIISAEVVNKAMVGAKGSSLQSDQNVAALVLFNLANVRVNSPTVCPPDL